MFIVSESHTSRCVFSQFHVTGHTHLLFCFATSYSSTSFFEYNVQFSLLRQRVHLKTTCLLKLGRIKPIQHLSPALFPLTSFLSLPRWSYRAVPTYYCFLPSSAVKAMNQGCGSCLLLLPL